jgi:hypothetical protein
MMVITNVPEREDWSGKAQNSMKMYPLGDIRQLLFSRVWSSRRRSCVPLLA